METPEGLGGQIDDPRTGREQMSGFIQYNVSIIGQVVRVYDSRPHDIILEIKFQKRDIRKVQICQQSTQSLCFLLFFNLWLPVDLKWGTASGLFFLFLQ